MADWIFIYWIFAVLSFVWYSILSYCSRTSLRSRHMPCSQHLCCGNSCGARTLANPRLTAAVGQRWECVSWLSVPWLHQRAEPWEQPRRATNTSSHCLWQPDISFPKSPGPVNAVFLERAVMDRYTPDPKGMLPDPLRCKHIFLWTGSSNKKRGRYCTEDCG